MHLRECKTETILVKWVLKATCICTPWPQSGPICRDCHREPYYAHTSSSSRGLILSYPLIFRLDGARVASLSLQAPRVESFPRPTDTVSFCSQSNPTNGTWLISLFITEELASRRRWTRRPGQLAPLQPLRPRVTRRRLTHPSSSHSAARQTSVSAAVWPAWWQIAAD